MVPIRGIPLITFPLTLLGVASFAASKLKARLLPCNPYNQITNTSFYTSHYACKYKTFLDDYYFCKRRRLLLAST